MILERLSFKNFRCFRNETIVLSDYISFVGPNNCGKSTVLRAISALYDENIRGSSFYKSDFHVDSEENELSITFEFTQLDEASAAELSHYVRSGRVVFELIAHRSPDGNITTKCRGIRFGIPALASFFAATTAAARRPIYDALRASGIELPAWQNMPQAEGAVRQYEAANPDQHTPIPSEENAYGATGPIHKIKKYLDWIYIPAVKDASAEASELRTSAFSKLILLAIRSKHNFSEQIRGIQERAADEMRQTIEDAGAILNEVGGDIDKLFKSLTTSRVDIALKWNEPESLVVREPTVSSIFKDGRVIGSPELFGHGLQRTYLMALLSLAARAAENGSAHKLMIGIEEPELYQHPPQARFLANALCELAESNHQILITTHSPFFVSGKNFENIRNLRKVGNTTHIKSWSVDEQRNYCAVRRGEIAIGAGATLSGLDKTLQTNIAEIFFASKVILVEGIEDVAIVTEYLRGRKLLSEFLSYGCHIVPVGGKTKMPMLISLSRGFSIDLFCLFDMDMDKSENDQCNLELIRYAQDNEIQINTGVEEYFESDLYFAWRENIQNAILKDCPDWVDILQQISTEWGWNYSRMKKDPMLLGEGVRRLAENGQNLPAMDALIECLRKFWLR